MPIDIQIVIGKIERWGYCNDACKDDNDSFMYANMNILTDEECTELFKPHGGGKEAMSLNLEYELCVGKKHSFPHSIISFQRRKKSAARQKKELNDALKYNLAVKDTNTGKIRWPTVLKPTKYWYKMNPKQTRVSLGTKENYPYDWFIGGVDSCQGDSGGPLWRNVKVCKTFSYPTI